MLLVDQLHCCYDTKKKRFADFSYTLKPLPGGSNLRQAYAALLEPKLRQCCGWGALRISRSETWCSQWSLRQFRFAAGLAGLLISLISGIETSDVSVELKEDFDAPENSVIAIKHFGLRVPQQARMYRALMALEGLHFSAAARAADHVISRDPHVTNGPLRPSRRHTASCLMQALQHEASHLSKMRRCLRACLKTGIATEAGYSTTPP